MASMKNNPFLRAQIFNPRVELNVKEAETQW